MSRIHLKGLLDIAQRVISKRSREKGSPKKRPCRYFKTPNGLEWRMPLDFTPGWGRRDPDPWAMLPRDTPMTLQHFVHLLASGKCEEYQPTPGDE